MPDQYWEGYGLFKGVQRSESRRKIAGSPEHAGGTPVAVLHRVVRRQREGVVRARWNGQVQP